MNLLVWCDGRLLERKIRNSNNKMNNRRIKLEQIKEGIKDYKTRDCVDRSGTYTKLGRWKREMKDHIWKALLMTWYILQNATDYPKRKWPYKKQLTIKTHDIATEHQTKKSAVGEVRCVWSWPCRREQRHKKLQLLLFQAMSIPDTEILLRSVEQALNWNAFGENA